MVIAPFGSPPQPSRTRPKPVRTLTQNGAAPYAAPLRNRRRGKTAVPRRNARCANSLNRQTESVSKTEPAPLIGRKSDGYVVKYAVLLEPAPLTKRADAAVAQNVAVAELRGTPPPPDV